MFDVMELQTTRQELLSALEHKSAEVDALKWDRVARHKQQQQQHPGSSSSVLSGATPPRTPGSDGGQVYIVL